MLVTHVSSNTVAVLHNNLLVCYSTRQYTRCKVLKGLQSSDVRLNDFKPTICLSMETTWHVSDDLLGFPLLFLV